MADFVTEKHRKVRGSHPREPDRRRGGVQHDRPVGHTGNPFACTAYETAGTSHQPVEKSKETYAAEIVSQDADAKKRGTASHSFDTVAGYSAGITALTGAAGLNTAHNGTPVHNAAGGHLLRDPEVPRRERGDLHGHLRPGRA